MTEKNTKETKTEKKEKGNDYDSQKSKNPNAFGSSFILKSRATRETSSWRGCLFTTTGFTTG